MPAYLDVDVFKLQTAMPSSQVDQLEALEPGYLAAQFATVSAYVDTRIGKRLRVPLASPYSPTVVGLIVRIVTLDAYLKLGVPADDQQVQMLAQAAADARADLKEIADGQLSLFDLAPSDQSRDTVAFGGVLAYSEASPYAHKDVQVQRGREEDRGGRGGSGWPT
jgi:hypothetical protein